jgi:hypothetical protein
MSEIVLTKTRIRSGIWEGVLSGAAAAPVLEVILLERILPGTTVTAVPERPGDWAVRVPVPAEVLNEGVQTFMIRDKATQQSLAHFTIITGVAMEDDLRAEVDLLRAELDMLKRAFRRHCVETMV